jgi:hypothetical protein
MCGTICVIHIKIKGRPMDWWKKTEKAFSDLIDGVYNGKKRATKRHRTSKRKSR